MTNHLTLTNIKKFGENLRKYLWEQYKKIPEKPIKVGEVSRVTHIRVLTASLPDWAREIAELSFKDFKNPNKKIDWDPDFLESLEFSRPIL
ncbi:MAG: hypothetical protein WC849_00980 [Candidatus Paceibacterota bacterium]